MDDPTVREVAGDTGSTPAQVALQWLIRQPKVIALPMSRKREHLQENLGALGLVLSNEDVGKLDRIELSEAALWPE